MIWQYRDRQTGISNSYLSIPSGLIYETAIVDGSGINAMIYICELVVKFNHCIQQIVYQK